MSSMKPYTVMYVYQVFWTRIYVYILQVGAQALPSASLRFNRQTICGGHVGDLHQGIEGARKMGTAPMYLIPAVLNLHPTISNFRLILYFY
jgi:hypothetical protein